MQKKQQKGSKRISLKRLTSHKGSVLFLVVALMSVLVVLASAIYYSVNSARKQVEVKYDGEQSYQSALALNDLVTEYIGTRGPSDTFITALVDLDENATLTTKSADGSNFSELAAGLGDYKITIKKVKGDGSDQIHVLEIVTEMDVNGEKSVISTVGEFQIKTRPYTFDRFFTSTGYAPNDVIISGTAITSTLYLDNEYSQIGSTSGSNSGLSVNSEVICAGTLRFNNCPINTGTNPSPFDFTIGNNLYLYGNNADIYLNGGAIKVGGSLAQRSNCYAFESNTPVYILEDFYAATSMSSVAVNDAVYVNGDLVVFGNMNYSGTIYVNGNVFVDSSHNQSQIANKLVVGGNVYTYNFPDWKKNGYFSADKATISGEFIDCAESISLTLDTDTTVEDLQEEITKIKADNPTSSGSTTGGYSYVWPSATMQCESLQQITADINDKLGNPEYINWDLENKFKVGDSLMTPVVPSFTYSQKVVTYSAGINGTKYVLGDIDIQNDWLRPAIVFDTSMGDGTYEDIYVYLQPNVKEIYSNGSYSYTTNCDPSEYNAFRFNEDKAGPVHCMVKGKGSLIIVVPDNVKYVNGNMCFVGHVGVYEELNGASARDAYGNLTGEQKEMGAFGNYITKINNLLDDNNRFKTNIIAKHEANGNYIHNNVFIVTVEKNAQMSFDPQQNVFAGFVYAPYMTFTSSATGQAGMLGGLIVSDYTMDQTSNTYICTVPYDYYDKFVSASLTEAEKEEERAKYMEHLMADSGCNTLLGSSTSRTWRKYGYN